MLEEKNHWLRSLAEQNLEKPKLFFDDLMEGLGPLKNSKSAAAVVRVLKSTLPSDAKATRFATRAAGKGSLGRQRYVVFAGYEGGEIVREAKALALSAWKWAHPKPKTSKIYCKKIVNEAVRAVDPFVKFMDRWVTRRLAPDCVKIELNKLKLVHVEAEMLYAMGWETANVHLGSKKMIKAIHVRNRNY